VKIIQHAKNGNSWAVGKVFLCEGCSKKLEVEPNDVILTYKENGKPPVYYLVCPACDTAVPISVRHVVKQDGTRSVDDGRILG